jgi:hypothetical protein
LRWLSNSFITGGEFGHPFDLVLLNKLAVLSGENKQYNMAANYCAEFEKLWPWFDLMNRSCESI